MSNPDEGFPWWIILFLCLLPILLDSGEDKSEPQTNQQTNEELVEGVVERLIPSTEGFTTVVFDDGHQKDLYLGDHQIHVGEWNQLRINSTGFVQEVWLGEGTLQEMARR